MKRIDFGTAFVALIFLIVLAPLIAHELGTAVRAFHEGVAGR